MRESAVPLRPVTGFPGLRLLRALRPAVRPSAGDAPSRTPRAWKEHETGTGQQFPRSLRTDRPARCPSMPQRHRHDYAADLHHGLPASDTNQPRSSPARPSARVRTAYQPRSTGFELVVLLKGFTTTVPLVHLPISLARPAPSGSTDVSRRCRGCSRPSRRPPGQAAPSFTNLLRQASGGALPSPLGSTAPRGAP
jgi:hypothetical protein